MNPRLVLPTLQPLHDAQDSASSGGRGTEGAEMGPQRASPNSPQSLASFRVDLLCSGHNHNPNPTVNVDKGAKQEWECQPLQQPTLLAGKAPQREVVCSVPVSEERPGLGDRDDQTRGKGKVTAHTIACPTTPQELTALDNDHAHRPGGMARTNGWGPQPAGHIRPAESFGLPVTALRVS